VQTHKIATVYLVFACLFSCTALFVGISQVIGCEDRLRNDLYCVGWGVKLCSTATVSYYGGIRRRIPGDVVRKLGGYNPPEGV